MLEDRYGQPVSTASRVARDAYVLGVDALLGAGAAVHRHLLRAIEIDPDFALGWIALARARMSDGDALGARAAAARARELAGAASERERSHVHALALAIDGQPAAALEATVAHLAKHPRDALVVMPCTGVFGLFGFSGRLDREVELASFMDGLAPHYVGDWWFCAVHAFADCEVGRLASARVRIERSMAANPRNGHGAHILAHVLHETGEAAAAIDFLDGWLPSYERSALLHCHLSWHAALVTLALGRVDEAWRHYRGAVHPGASWGPPLNTVTDAVSFLWRAELAGLARDDTLWQQVAAWALARFPAAGTAFADVHVALACACAGDHASYAHRSEEVRRRLAAGSLAAGEVVQRLIEGFAAYAGGDWETAIDLLEPALPQVVRIGGSRAQRDLVMHTLLAACLKAGRVEQSRRLLEHRLERLAPLELRGLPGRG